MSISQAFLNKATLWGEAPFTTVLCFKGQPVFKQHHLKRLEKTIDEVYSSQNSKSVIDDIEVSMDSISKEYEHCSHSYMRVTLFEDLAGSLEFFIWSFEREPSRNSISLKSRPFVGASDYSSAVKKSDYSFKFRQRDLVKKDGHDDIVFFNKDSDLLDTTTANLFGIKDGVIVKTEIISGVLDGICAQEFIKYASVENISYKTQRISLKLCILLSFIIYFMI